MCLCVSVSVWHLSLWVCVFASVCSAHFLAVFASVPWGVCLPMSIEVLRAAEAGDLLPWQVTGSPPKECPPKGGSPKRKDFCRFPCYCNLHGG